MQKRLMARIFRRFRPHLTTDCLIAFLDEELDHKQRKHAASHIYECPSCAERVRDIHEALHRFQLLDSPTDGVPPPDPAESIKKLRENLSAWKSDRQNTLLAGEPAPFAESDLGGRLGTLLRIYLGSRAASALIESSIRPETAERDLLARARPLLETYLGKAAASAVGEQILQLFERERRLASHLRSD